ncbi:hypothetical protein LCM02_12355 [Lutimonas saemankumensis]|uniref:hypothetical protein n=1 Tax=Lutimonas saemankumensis TaxID=483016 RepID=UPI001CD26200|nr:hypothetical protein [Lutimonas saemankumensis]MCA0933246.1 hypothetical protein [Lutimonas saemankumensis]
MRLILPILTNNRSGSLSDFISFWSNIYSYDDSEKYEFIHNDILSKSDLTQLYEWKNGMKLSVSKTNSLKSKIIKKLDIINSLKAEENIDIDEFLKEFKNVSVVWKIFLLHIINPKIYPIYDQHIHRAFRFINNQSTEGINASINEKDKLNFYFVEYLPFVTRTGETDLKKMDEAFFAFGQFINIGNQKILAE